MWYIVIAVLIVFLNSRASTRICFHANLTEAYCRQLSNTSTSQVWKRNIKTCESYSSFNQISEFTCITLTHMYACSRKMTSVLHLNTTCLFILKRFQHHILSFFLRTLAENWLNWFWSCFSGSGWLMCLFLGHLSHSLILMWPYRPSGLWCNCCSLQNSSFHKIKYIWFLLQT